MRLSFLLRTAAVSSLGLFLTVPAFAWGAKGHRLINRLAIEKLPADVPEFLRSHEAVEQIDYQGPEPDRWYSPSVPELNAAQSPDHFINMEWAKYAGQPLPRKRYDYIRALAAAQPQHTDVQLTPEKAGMQPYIVTEVWERLENAMRDYRTALAAKQPTKPVEALIVFYAGWLGHYVADGSQPLHVTYRYNGWEGDNPNGYSVDHHIHSRFETSFVNANIEARDIAPLVPAKPLPHGDIFDDYYGYLTATNAYVEKLYQIDKTGGFTDKGTPEGKAFAAERMAAGATELRDLIYFAWTASAIPLPPTPSH